MKKNIYFIILITFLLFPNLVGAKIKNEGSDWIYQENIDNNTYLPLCSYKHHLNATDEVRINIYFGLKNSNWFVAWDSNTTSKKKEGTFDSVFSTKGQNVMIDPNLIEALKFHGVCPAIAWRVGNGLTTKPCFGSKEFCGVKDSYDNAERTFSFNDRIDSFFTNWKKNNKYTCEDLRTKNINIKYKLTNDIKISLFEGNNVPYFIADNSKYKNGIEEIENSFANLKKQCDEEIKNNSSLSEQEKNDLLNENQSGLQDVQNGISESQQEINKDSNQGNSNNSSNNNFSNTDSNNNNNSNQNDKTIANLNNICNEIKVQNALKFIGYLLLIIKIVIPILLIVMGTVDFAKAVVSSNDDETKKATQKLIFRVIAGVVIFLLPTIVHFAFDLVKNDDNTYEQCGECIFNPRDCN